MKKLLATALLLFPSNAHAETTLAPVAGAAFGSWIDVPVTRAVVGVELNHPIGQNLDGTAFFLAEPGRTELGLGAHRFAVGYGVFVGPTFLQLGAGVDLSYALLERETKQDSFWHALGGDIGGFGVGAHATLRVAIPVGGHAILLAARGSVALYDGGKGYELGPTLGFRF